MSRAKKILSPSTNREKFIPRVGNQGRVWSTPSLRALGDTKGRQSRKLAAGGTRATRPRRRPTRRCSQGSSAPPSHGRRKISTTRATRRVSSAAELAALPHARTKALGHRGGSLRAHVIRRAILDARNVKGLDAFGAFIALTTMQVTFRTDTRKSPFQGKCLTHPDHLFLRQLAEWGADTHPLIQTLREHFLHVCIKPRRAIRKGIGAKWR